MLGRTRAEGKCTMPRVASGSRRPLVCILDVVPVTVIEGAELGLEPAAGGWFQESGIGECSSRGNVLHKRKEEHQSLSGSDSFDMKYQSAGRRGDSMTK
jgi:hypothetical protein